MDPLMNTDQSDPKADKILQQLGLHPSQISARTSLGLGGVTPALPPNPSTSGPTPIMKPLLDSPSTSPAPTGEVAQPTTPPHIPSPMSTPSMSAAPNPIVSNASNQIQTAQNELQRLHSTGSGISQIQNPFLRNLARVGDVAASGLAPGIERAIPGTEGHHRDLESQENNLIQTGEKTKGEEVAQGEQEAQTQKTLNTPAPTSDLQEWLKENGPDADIKNFWEQQNAAKNNAGKTPAEQVYHYLTTPVEKGGKGLDPASALGQVSELDAQSKPDTKEQNSERLQNTLSKAFPEGKVDPGIMSDSRKLGSFIAQSDKLSPQEKSELLSHFIFNTSPASQGTNVIIRTAGMEQSRMYPVIDKSTGTLQMVSSADINAKPGQYAPATQGQQSLTKESIFQDLHFNIGQVRDAIAGLRTPFSNAQKAQVSYLLRSTDPHSAVDQFLNSKVGQTLTPDQIDYVTALPSLQENALAMRSIAGLGQGSDELRAAITKTIPGPGTPSADYAKRQLDIFEGTVNRLEHGVSHSGVTQPENKAVAKTGESEPGKISKTFTRAQVQSAADKAGITYEAAKADAESKGHKVDETK